MASRFKFGLLEDIFNSTIESFHHPVCLRVSWLDQAVLDTMIGTNFIKQVVACWLPLASCTVAISKFFAIISENLVDSERCCINEIF